MKFYEQLIKTRTGRAIFWTAVAISIFMATAAPSSDCTTC